ncbi:hypothetical protein D9M68_730450 [compost metagenome]
MAAAMALSISACVTVSPAARPRMQPFCAPWVRRWRVSLRVSMFAMATVLPDTRYSVSVAVLRKLEATRGRSLMIRPAAWILSASMSSPLTP